MQFKVACGTFGTDSLFIMATVVSCDYGVYNLPEPGSSEDCLLPNEVPPWQCDSVALDRNRVMR